MDCHKKSKAAIVSMQYQEKFSSEKRKSGGFWPLLFR
jgi:hypothetical protein